MYDPSASSSGHSWLGWLGQPGGKLYSVCKKANFFCKFVPFFQHPRVSGITRCHFPEDEGWAKG